MTITLRKILFRKVGMCVKTNFSLFLIRKWKSILMSHVNFSVGFVLETWIYNIGGGGGGGGGGERKEEEEEEEEQQGETELNPFFSWFNKILFLLYLYIVIGGEGREGGGGGGAKVIMFINHHVCFLNKKNPFCHFLK